MYPGVLRKSELIMFSHNAEIIFLTSIIKQYNHTILDFDKLCTFSLICAMEICINQNRVKMNFPSLHNLVDNRVFSHIMAWKIAGSGLKFHHLELAHKRKPDGIHVSFTEEHVGTVRVTRSRKLIESVVT